MKLILSLVKTNAYTELEKACALKVCEYLAANKFPAERFEVSVLFKDTMRDHSDTSLKIPEHLLEADSNGPLEGQVDIKFNSLFLSQDPYLFIEYVIAHEVAHVFNELKAISQKTKYKKHGVEWKDWLSVLEQDHMIESKVASLNFDPRACIARAGGCIAACDCNDSDYRAFSIRSQEYVECNAGDYYCGVCEGEFRVIPPKQVQGKLADELNFLHLISGKRNSVTVQELIGGT
jgi:predicted SprT family Zn-dependent metalloprotease